MTNDAGFIVVAGVSVVIGFLLGVAFNAPSANRFVRDGKPYCESALLGGQEIRRCWRAVEVPAEEARK